MAVLWQKQDKDRLYEVRTAGDTLRLYTNGVLHTQYNPCNPVTGSVWDLLFIPSYFYPAEDIKRILILGVGGGALIRQFNHFFTPSYIEGVDLNETHLYVAKRFFRAKSVNVKLTLDSAEHWLSNYEGPKFDLIIDDLFDDSEGVPQRAVPVDAGWASQLTEHLSDTGMLVINFAGVSEAKSALALNKKKHGFVSRFRIRSNVLDNTIGVYARRENLQTGDLRAALWEEPLLDPRKRSARLDYYIRKV